MQDKKRIQDKLTKNLIAQIKKDLSPFKFYLKEINGEATFTINTKRKG